MRELVLEVERPEFIYAIGQSMGLIVPGPFGLPFAVPDNRDADLLLVGMGTGIAHSAPSSSTCATTWATGAAVFSTAPAPGCSCCI